MNKPTVSICCLVYNHASYLRECLEGFLMQKTDFEYEVLIHDDASTDGSTEIILEYQNKYPDIIKPYIQKENTFQRGKTDEGTYINFNRAQGKYIALCEGDDYWIDPLKLQKQVDILMQNPKYGCVYTAYKTVDSESKDCNYIHSIRNMKRSFTGDVFYALTNGNFPQTLTILFEKELLMKIDKNWPKLFDHTLFLNLALYKEFYYLNEITGAYRINPNGIMQTRQIMNYNSLGNLSHAYDIYNDSKVYWRESGVHKSISRNLYRYKMSYLKRNKRYREMLLNLFSYKLFGGNLYYLRCVINSKLTKKNTCRTIVRNDSII